MTSPGITTGCDTKFTKEMHKYNPEKIILKVLLHHVVSYPQKVFQITSYLAFKVTH